MRQAQKGILAPVPQLARYLLFSIAPGKNSAGSLRNLCKLADGDKTVVGLGQSLVLTVGGNIPGLAVFPTYAASDIDVPSTQTSLWCWLRGDDRGELIHRGRAIARSVAPGLQLEQIIDGFRYKSGFDLSGYEDRTENPKGAAAVKVAIVTGQGAGFDGGSFVAVQQGVHDLNTFEAMTTREQEHAMGRRKRDNKEIGNAPTSAYVKRTAQESFDPHGFYCETVYALGRRTQGRSSIRGVRKLFLRVRRTVAKNGRRRRWHRGRVVHIHTPYFRELFVVPTDGQRAPRLAQGRSMTKIKRDGLSVAYEMTRAI